MGDIPEEIIGVFAILGFLMFLFAVAVFLHALLLKLIMAHKEECRKKNVSVPKCNCAQCDYWRQEFNDPECGCCTIWEKWTVASDCCSRGDLRKDRDTVTNDF